MPAHVTNLAAWGLFEQFLNQFGTRGLALMMDSHQKENATSTISCPDVIDAYLKHIKTAGVSRSFFNSTSSRLRRVADVFCGPLCDISPVDLDGYIQSSSTNAATRASVRAVVLGLFNFAQRKGWLKQDAATAASKAEKYKIPVREPEIFTPEQFDALLMHTRHNHDAQAVLIIGGMAGVRRAELQRMTWACWDREHNNLVLPPSITKTKRRRICSLEPAAQEWLAVLSEGKLPTDPIQKFCRSVSNCISAAAKAAGFEWAANGLRHSYVSYHMELHDNAALTAKNAGHSVAVLEQNYLQLTNKAAATKWFGVRPTESNFLPCPPPILESIPQPAEPSPSYPTVPTPSCSLS